MKGHAIHAWPLVAPLTEVVSASGRCPPWHDGKTAPRESGAAMIDRFEIQTARRTGSPEQVMLRLLKQKGAPVTGSLFFALDTGYAWLRDDNTPSLCTTFTWLAIRRENDV